MGELLLSRSARFTRQGLVQGVPAWQEGANSDCTALHDNTQHCSIRLGWLKHCNLSLSVSTM